MKYLALLLVLFGATRSRAKSNSQVVRGTVLDAVSKSPLMGATVLIVIASLSEGIATEQNGRFHFAKVPFGRMSLKLVCLGYQERIVPNAVVKGRAGRGAGTHQA